MTIMKKTHSSTSAQLLRVHNVYKERHYFYECSLTDTKFIKSIDYSF